MADFYVNSAAMLVVGAVPIAGFTQILAIMRPPAAGAAGPRRAVASFANFWYAELDAAVGTALYVILLVISLLPIARFHSSLLFNRTYAAEVAVMSRRHHLLVALQSFSAFGFIKTVCAVVWFRFWGVLRWLGRCWLWCRVRERRPGDAAYLPLHFATAAAAAAPAGTAQVGRRQARRRHADHRLPRLVAPPPRRRRRRRRRRRAGGLARPPSLESLRARPSARRRRSPSRAVGAARVGPLAAGARAERSTSRVVTLRPRQARPWEARAKWRRSEPPSVDKRVTALSLGERQALLRALLRPIASRLATRFGFQRTATEKGATVPSSVANQLEHLVGLLAHRMDGSELPFELALQRAAALLDEKLLGNFMRWVRHVGLPRFVRDDSSEEGPMLTLASFTLSVWDFASAEEGALWLLNAQLHRLMLYLLLWGEAANVRHLPEGMCYIFYCAASSLLVRDTRRSTTRRPRCRRRSSRGRAPRASPSPPPSSARGGGHYLQRVITALPLPPVADFEARERTSRRVMYDDVNESFALPALLNEPLMKVAMEAQKEGPLDAPSSAAAQGAEREGAPDLAPRGEPRVVVHARRPQPRRRVHGVRGARRAARAGAQRGREADVALGLLRQDVLRGDGVDARVPRVLPRLHVALRDAPPHVRRPARRHAVELHLRLRRQALGAVHGALVPSRTTTR